MFKSFLLFDYIIPGKKEHHKSKGESLGGPIMPDKQEVEDGVTGVVAVLLPTVVSIIV